MNTKKNRLKRRSLIQRFKTLEWFLFRCAEKLNEYPHKPDWSMHSYPYLLMKLKGEVEELDISLQEDSPDEIIRECADVANFAMMIADNIHKGTMK